MPVSDKQFTEQVLSAIQTLLESLVSAAKRDNSNKLQLALQKEDNHAYNGLLTFVVRLVVLLYAEERELLFPSQSENLSILQLYQELKHADKSNNLKEHYSSYKRLLTLFRHVHDGVNQDGLQIPARGGFLFDPTEFPFLGDRSNIPSVNDDAVYAVLLKLMVWQAKGSQCGHRVPYDVVEVEQIGGLYEALMGYTVQNNENGQLSIKDSGSRGSTGSHYTPRELTEPIVRHTLEPVLASLAHKSSSGALRSQDILDLKICDPAVGSGAFLLETCRYLADHLVSAWTREDTLPQIVDAHKDPVRHARRLIAQRCLYGVDKNPFAVHLTKLTMWLMIQDRSMPFTFMDHSLRYGDALVGLNLEQIESFNWNPSEPVPQITKVVRRAMKDVLEVRQRLSTLVSDASEQAQNEVANLLQDAEKKARQVTLIADLCIGAFFSSDKRSTRDQARLQTLQQVTAWLDNNNLDSITLPQNQPPTLHWEIAFPEVFYPRTKTSGIDAFVGNPPFLGGFKISGNFGNSYRDWLLQVHPGSHGNSDIAAHFFRRADTLLNEQGTIGFIATNTIAQGDTRTTGLQPMVKTGSQIYRATSQRRWPGVAHVIVSIVHLAKGDTKNFVKEKVLDDKRVQDISSRLRALNERPDPVRIVGNQGFASMGVAPCSLGFIITPDERDSLIARNPINAERIFPFLGGKEVNTSPSQSFHKYIINFGNMSLEQAQRWPDLLDIVRTRVKPRRDKSKRRTSRDYWWQFVGKREDLYSALAPLSRCLVTSRVSKHNAFSFQPTDRVLDEHLYVFPIETYTFFTILQSRIHATWVQLLASTMKTDQRYVASDCFDTFPFPQPDPRTVLPKLESLGEQIYEQRAKLMLDRERGLTQTYNTLKDPKCTEPAIVDLREMHCKLDRAVLAAYGWEDITVPLYTTPTTPAEHDALEAFKNAVIERLTVLNHTRCTMHEHRS